MQERLTAAIVVVCLLYRWPVADRTALMWECLRYHV